VSVYVRRSARVLVVDGSERILLLRFANPDGGHGWITPGGGVGDGESIVDAAARELREEIGLTVAAAHLGDPVAYSTGRVVWLDGLCRDDYFYHRVDAHDVDDSGMEAFERTHHRGHRWWTVDELRVTTELVYPPRLAALLTDLLAGRVREPVELPWPV
jgi:8-oxo-dGTP pyrophosphatase MutT (NUDIX family)